MSLDAEIAEAVSTSPARAATSVTLSPALHAKVLQFAVDNGLDRINLVRCDGMALAVMANRYLTLVSREDGWPEWSPAPKDVE